MAKKKALVSEAAKDAASKAYDKEVKRAAAVAASDQLAIPRFLQRSKQTIAPVAIPEPTTPPQLPTPSTDMVILSMYLSEGGHRRFLWVNEGNKIAHLLYVPTLEYIKVPVTEIQRQKAIGRATVSPVEQTMAAILRAKAQQWDDLQRRFSRILVNEALGKLGAAALPVIQYADDNIERVEGEQPAGKPRGAKAATASGASRSRGDSKKDMVGNLLLRPEGCTTKDILDATGWPSVSVPAQAKAAGLALRKEKAPGQPTRYYGSKL